MEIIYIGQLLLEICINKGTINERINKINEFKSGNSKYGIQEFKKEGLYEKIYQRIVYLVIQFGTALKEGVNTGVYNNKKLKVKRYDEVK